MNHQRQHQLSLQQVLLLCLLGSAAAQQASPQEEGKICTSPTNTFTVIVDIYASERGYYTFEECGVDWVNPTIGLEYGETYTFVQKDRSNFMHPLGFSYFPDAIHVGGDILDPQVDPRSLDGSIITTTTTSASGNAAAESAAQAAAASCALNMTCAAPMYYLNDAPLGTYNNLPVGSGVNDTSVAQPSMTTMESETGRKLYHDFFDKSMGQWTGYGTFSVKLRFTDESYASDLFYDCKIHQFMAGRIKLLKNGEAVQANKDNPAMYYDTEIPGDGLDKTCGVRFVTFFCTASIDFGFAGHFGLTAFSLFRNQTYGLEGFALPNPQCISNFVCDPDESMKEFASCIDAMDCHMFIAMSTKVSSRTELALFLHQMIPHHQNAVNLAKAVLHKLNRPCTDLTDATDPYCVMEGLLYATVNRQNYEIGVMNNVLAAMNLPPTDDCQVFLSDPESAAAGGMCKAAAGAMAGVAATAAAYWM